MPATFSISRVDPGACTTFDAWSRGLGFTGRREAFLFLTRAMRDGRLAVMDKLTKELLVGDAREYVLRQARAESRHETRKVLYEEGFISDPGAVHDGLVKVPLPKATP